MTKAWLIILRIICLIQLVVAIYKTFSFLTSLVLTGDLILLGQSVVFALIAALPIFTLTVFSYNFPDKMIVGRQKRNFNRLFLVNFILSTILFGFVFKDYKSAQAVARLSETPIYKLDILLLAGLLISFTMLVFHFIILYGLFWLRSYINYHVNRKQFDFELQEGID